MDSAIVLLIALAACVCLAAVVIGLVLLMNNNNNMTKKDDTPKDVFKGLPTAPPKIPPDVLQLVPSAARTLLTAQWDYLVKNIFESYSNCWEANYWLRVTLPSLMADVMRKIAANPQAGTRSQAVTQAYTRAQLSVQDLAKCPKQATITLSSASNQLSFGQGVKGQPVTYTIEEILKKVDDFKAGKTSSLL